MYIGHVPTRFFFRDESSATQVSISGKFGPLNRGCCGKYNERQERHRHVYWPVYRFSPSRQICILRWHRNWRVVTEYRYYRRILGARWSRSCNIGITEYLMTLRCSNPRSAKKTRHEIDQKTLLSNRHDIPQGSYEGILRNTHTPLPFPFRVTRPRVWKKAPHTQSPSRDAACDKGREGGTRWSTARNSVKRTNLSKNYILGIIIAFVLAKRTLEKNLIIFYGSKII